ncbi:replication-associated recombination protein A [Flavobacteriaceae bacterium]|jgi:putative ATPase|uniref:replication-associated recombination protein A n=1 Tax=Candidatus Arcticimaribacter forsetii TaxID=2820661 RepID=UPI00207722E5|nr:replication-associated recombination protein A [Candidatus Arcticimaribacter forsetii]MDA8639399.1 replication-associated recombination protein A [Flavobacteriaceae bacterium]MDB2329407.1 replication-associated recombination protein A [Flavobacteriaceae bacterium]MDB4674723.1 replication-associated recombination protein A [Flavobacteriaceae bacterium]MDB4751980.1 replication-associated recombination protein A [Flavobacteriaceae bacterium]MDC0960064.1 replication-associated recombination pro
MIAPLAERMRPHTIEEYAGQQHLVGAQGALRPILKTGQLPSLIFWGPPGTGKTTLAMLMSKIIDRPFYSLSAINSGVKEVRDIIEKAKNSGGLFTQKGPLLFIDEIHRFSKSQQDSLLGAVEKGFVTLIGATTENPSFEVIKALLSRCQVYTLKPLLKEDLQELLKRALEKDEILKQKKVTLVEDQALLKLSGGDARKMLSLLELVVMSQEGKEIDITDEIVLEKAQTKTVLFDKNGDQHYDIISAFIKSIRGSDPNAAVYWLARLIEGGEDVKFIARRLLILASEDIGNANPTALVLANNTFQAVTAIGYPEARIILSQCVIYLATSPKSNASYLAISKAQEIVNEHGSLQVPLPLRNAASSLMKDLDYGKGYQYAHDYNLNFVNQEFLPEELSNTRIFEPGQNSKENAIRSFLKERWEDKYGY